MGEEDGNVLPGALDEIQVQAGLVAAYYHALREAQVPEDAAALIAAHWIGATQQAAMTSVARNRPRR